MAIIPDSNVHLATNVRDVLNAAGGSVTNDVTSFFTEDAKINKWARYKPTIYPNLLFPDGTEEPLQWQASNGLCGFTEGSIVFNTVEDLVSAYDNNATYVYQLPTGGAAAPLRVGDFRNYKTNAMPPIWSFEYSGQMATNNQNSDSTFTILGNGDIDEYCIHLSDIWADAADMGSLSNYYFGVILKDSNGDIVLTKKSGNPIGADVVFNNNSVTVTINEIPNVWATTYYAYPALINGTGDTFVACPIGKIEFQILSSVDASKLGWTEGSGSITYIGRGRYTYEGQLSYSSDWEGVHVWVDLEISGEDSGHGEEIVLAKDSESSDGSMYYMNYSNTVSLNDADGKVFRLRCGYGDNWLNNAYLGLGSVVSEEPE